ncbi:hypothetical protein QBC35DRAFT_365329, partial [Podospora australis]
VTDTPGIGPTTDRSITTLPKPRLRYVSILDTTGDILIAPPNTLIIRSFSRSTSGVHDESNRRDPFWDDYPDHYKTFQKALSHRWFLRGTALLIIPPAGSAPLPLAPVPSAPRRRFHYIGCLFTSNFDGKHTDDEGTILRATESALMDLLSQIAWSSHRKFIHEIRMYPVNKDFGVPWYSTRLVLDGLEI